MLLRMRAEMPMKKKTKATARRGAKRRKTVMAQRKVAPQLPSRASPPRLSVAHNGAKLTIRRLRTQLATALARIERLEASADTDFLLDIHNRRGFERELNRSIAYIKRYHASGALIVLDVDRLKPINDQFGHAAGDRVLKAVAAVLLRNVRSSDEVGQLGGDEFALILWNMNESDATAKAASLEQAIDDLSFTFRGRTVTAGGSPGGAILWPPTGAGRALGQTDSAMYVRQAQKRPEARLGKAEWMLKPCPTHQTKSL